MANSLLDCFLKGLTKSSKSSRSPINSPGSARNNRKQLTNKDSEPENSGPNSTISNTQSEASSGSMSPHRIRNHVGGGDPPKIITTPDYSAPVAWYSRASCSVEHGSGSIEPEYDNSHKKVTRLRSNSYTPGSQHLNLSTSSKSSSPNSPAISSRKLNDSLYQAPLMSTVQAKLLRKAWRRVGRKGDGGFGTLIFKHLFTKSPHIRGLFGFGSASIPQLRSNDTLFRNHARLFVQIIGDAITNMENLSAVTVELEKQGRFHAHFQEYGFRAEYWDMMGEAITESAMEWAGAGKHAELNRAWMILVSYIVDTLRNAFEQEVKRRKRATNRGSQWSSNRQGSLSNEDLTLIGKIESGAVSSHPPANYASNSNLEQSSTFDRNREHDQFAPSNSNFSETALNSQSAGSGRNSLNTLTVPQMSAQNRRRSLPLGGRTTMDIVEEFGLTMQTTK